MNVPSPVSSPPESAALSRRTVVSAGATGLALALLARSFSQATAQDATPEAEGGLPPGVAIIPMIDVPIPHADVPLEDFKISIYRITLEAGATIPEGTFAYPTTAYVESGTLTCPGGAPRYLVHADGSVEEVGDEDVIVSTGEAIYVPPQVLDGARNEGTDQLTILAVDLVPAEGMATPTA